MWFWETLCDACIERFKAKIPILFQGRIFESAIAFDLQTPFKIMCCIQYVTSICNIWFSTFATLNIHIFSLDKLTSYIALILHLTIEIQEWKSNHQLVTVTLVDPRMFLAHEI